MRIRYFPILLKARLVTRSLLSGLKLPRDREALVECGSRYSFGMAAHHLVKSGVWLNHALEKSKEDEKKLDDFLMQTKDLGKRLLDAEERASKANERATEADRLRESAEVALVTEKSTREDIEKKYTDVLSREENHLGEIERLDSEVKRLNGVNRKLEEEVVDAQVETFDVGYNDCVLVAKEKGLDYKILLLNPEKDTTLRAETSQAESSGKPEENIPEGQAVNLDPEVVVIENTAEESAEEAPEGDT